MNRTPKKTLLVQPSPLEVAGGSPSAIAHLPDENARRWLHRELREHLQEPIQVLEGRLQQGISTLKKVESDFIDPNLPGNRVSALIHQHLEQLKTRVALLQPRFQVASCTDHGSIEIHKFTLINAQEIHEGLLASGELAPFLRLFGAAQKKAESVINARVRLSEISAHCLQYEQQVKKLEQSSQGPGDVSAAQELERARAIWQAEKSKLAKEQDLLVHKIERLRGLLAEFRTDSPGALPLPIEDHKDSLLHLTQRDFERALQRTYSIERLRPWTPPRKPPFNWKPWVASLGLIALLGTVGAIAYREIRERRLALQITQEEAHQSEVANLIAHPIVQRYFDQEQQSRLMRTQTQSQLAHEFAQILADIPTKAFELEADDAARSLLKFKMTLMSPQKIALQYDREAALAELAKAFGPKVSLTVKLTAKYPHFPSQQWATDSESTLEVDPVALCEGAEPGFVIGADLPYHTHIDVPVPLATQNARYLNKVGACGVEGYLAVPPPKGWRSGPGLPSGAGINGKSYKSIGTGPSDKYARIFVIPYLRNSTSTKTLERFISSMEHDLRSRSPEVKFGARIRQRSAQGAEFEIRDYFGASDAKAQSIAYVYGPKYVFLMDLVAPDEATLSWARPSLTELVESFLQARNLPEKLSSH